MRSIFIIKQLRGLGEAMLVWGNILIIRTVLLSQVEVDLLSIGNDGETGINSNI